MNFLDMFKNPAFQQAGFSALGRTAGSPYHNPILEAALAGRQGLEQDTRRREEEEKRETAELAASLARKKSEEERRKEQLLRLSSMGLRDPAIRSRIKSAYGVDFPEWKAADEAAKQKEFATAALAKESATAKSDAIRAAAEGLPPDVKRVVDSLVAAGSTKDAVDLIESHSRPKSAPKRDAGPKFRAGPGGSIRQWDQAAGEWVTAPGGEGSPPRRTSSLQERMILAALAANDKERPRKREPDEEVIKVAMARAALLEQMTGGEPPAGPPPAGAPSRGGGMSFDAPETSEAATDLILIAVAKGIRLTMADIQNSPGATLDEKLAHVAQQLGVPVPGSAT